MKIIFALVLGLTSFSLAQADTTPAPALTTKITSFTHLNGAAGSTLGELCGTVTGMITGTLVPVTVISDPNSGNPGNYTVLVDAKGNFCIVINTYTGTASATAWIPGGGPAHPATAKLSQDLR